MDWTGLHYEIAGLRAYRLLLPYWGKHDGFVDSSLGTVPSAPFWQLCDLSLSTFSALRFLLREVETPGG